VLVRDLLEERGLDPAELADLLTDRGVTITQGKNAGAPITAEAVKRRINREVPGTWGPALGIEADPSSPRAATTAEPPGGTDGSGRREAPPRRPAEARVEITVENAGARKRISGAYKFMGAALAAGSGAQGVAVVWGDQADPIAELWLQAAQENPWAARFVNMLNAGGSAGDLAAAHLYLAGATLYVLGAGIPGGDAIFSKYTPHRVPVTPRPDPAANGHQPEAAEPAAEGAVVDGPG
jgi:hypothetical protein